jgi:hypothetical protein
VKCNFDSLAASPQQVNVQRILSGIPSEQAIAADEATENLQLKITLAPSPIQESVVIDGKVLDPKIDLRNDVIYKNTLFERDDQLIETLKDWTDGSGFKDVFLIDHSNEQVFIRKRRALDF